LRTSLSMDKMKEIFTRINKRDHSVDDPCHEEAMISMKCLEMAKGCKRLCQLQFLNYNRCREFWKKVIQERRSKGIQPALPPPDEREEILAAYFRAHS
ncbi:Coiled-coil-helix-coiled-coil-helix domain-containing protein 7, partial [Trichinella pseudospiralis]